MTSQSNIDRESFQKLLASAFAVQESGMAPESLSALIQVQQLMATGESDLNHVMQVIAEHARKVAGAAGVAIGVLRGEQLEYRAGSGSAANSVGRQLTAVLGVSAGSGSRGEILRVEDSESDARIEASICRQFGAKALLMLAIYQGRAVAGLMEVLFDEAHFFQDREVRTYRLMAGLVEEAMSREPLRAPAVRSSVMPFSLEASRTPVAQVGEEPSELRLEPIQEVEEEGEETDWVNDGVPRFGQFGGNSVPITERLAAMAERVTTMMRRATPMARRMKMMARRVAPVYQRAKTMAATGVTLSAQRIKTLRLEKIRWNVVGTVGAVAVLVIASLVAYNRRVGMAGAAMEEKSKVAEPPVSPAAVKPSPADKASQAQSAAREKGSNSAFKRVRVGPNEVDYVADDVTIRKFTPKTKAAQAPSAYKQVDIGNDVTVRYFPRKSAVVSQARPEPGASQPSGGPRHVSK